MGMRAAGPGLLGRAGERQTLDRLLENVRGGQSAVVVIRGEAGVGKTALVRYVARQAAGFRVAQVAGIEAEMELPFAGVHQLCAPMLDRLDALPNPQSDALRVALGLARGDPPDRFLLGLAVLSLLSAAAEERPLLCLVEDAHWLDAASGQVLGFVARRVLAESVAIVVAVREPSARRDFDGLPEMPLEGLSENAARTLLTSVTPVRLDERVRDRIIAETHGNPLALLELPRRMGAPELAGGFDIPRARDLPGHLEDHYLRRVDELPEQTRLLLLLAAADPVGDARLVWRAASRLGIETTALAPAEHAELVENGAHVRFRHPLVRSAVYRAASPGDRQRSHEALAEVSDAETDPDYRAWHRALAAGGPDEDVAAELERSAGRAQTRGGLAAAAAFLARAAALTPDRARRACRALAAAQAKHQAGAPEAALALLATADATALDALQRAQCELLRAEIAFVTNRGSAAPALLLRAAQQIEPLDPDVARDAYVEVLSAALFAARMAGPAGAVQGLAEAVRAARSPASRPGGADLLLDGWVQLFADGCAAATPTLRAALVEFGDGTALPEHLHFLWLVTITAPVVWDDERWDVLSRRHVELARERGALSELPLALNARGFIHLFRGDLDTAGALIDEARVATEATGAGLTPWGAVALAVLRGNEAEAGPMLVSAQADATQRGEGIGLTVLAWARAILYNGLGVYDKALAAAQEATECPTNSAASAWGLAECVEAAARAGDLHAAAEAAARFSAIARAAGTDWALGVDARSRALLGDDEELYDEALDRLGRGAMRVDLARAHLLYGEWLRRKGRRVDAREQLRTAQEMLDAIGMEAFAERARRELMATGEKVRKRHADVRDELTPQEKQIARLAREGLSNPEIGARLFLSSRTVEWHLHKVFTKLGIRSRRELVDALPAAAPAAVPV